MSQKVVIANPIYDAVFKFLLSDLKVAKLMLSVLLEKEIVELDFMPTEIIAKKHFDLTEEEKNSLKQSGGLTYFRIDFSAKVKDPNGNTTQIIIELQKAKLLTTVKRFRQYLGEQYANPNLMTTIKTLSGIHYQVGIPIYAIYILGYELDAFQDIPIISIENQVKDKYSQKPLYNSEPFITSLFHEGLIILIPALKGKHRTRVEKMLQIFEDSISRKELHLLEINTEDYPEELHPIITRLQMAAANTQLSKQMGAEDDLEAELEERELRLRDVEGRLEEQRKKTEEERQRAEKEQQRAEEERQRAEEERQRAEEERQRAEKERQRAEEERQRAEEERQRAEEERQRAEEMFSLSVKTLRQAGLTDEMIASSLKVPLQTIQNIQE